jgi:hypothetical protein
MLTTVLARTLPKPDVIVTVIMKERKTVIVVPAMAKFIDREDVFAFISEQ